MLARLFALEFRYAGVTEPPFHSSVIVLIPTAAPPSYDRAVDTVAEAEASLTSFRRCRTSLGDTGAGTFHTAVEALRACESRGEKERKKKEKRDKYLR